MPAPAEAICQEVAWKNPELRRFCIALVKAALAKGQDAEWTTDIVGDELRSLGTAAPGPGMAGSAVTVLKAAHVIEPVGIVNDGVFFARRQASERPGAKSRWLNVYKLVSYPLAKSFLARNQLNPSDSSAASDAPQPPVEQTLL